MKINIIKSLGIITMSALILISCSESQEGTNPEGSTISNDQEINSEENEEHSHSIEYKCPMDCEDGKTYNEPGDCPVCGMEVKEI